MRRIILLLIVGIAFFAVGCKIQLADVDESGQDADGVPDAGELSNEMVAGAEPGKIPEIQEAEIPLEELPPAEDEEYFLNASWECGDGRGGYEGFGVSCKGIKTWERYAAADCERRCGSCGVKQLKPVDACSIGESDSYLLKVNEKKTVSFSGSFVIVELHAVKLNGVAVFSVDYGYLMIRNATVEPFQAFIYENVTITNNKQFYDRKNPEQSEAELLVMGVVKPVIPIGRSACLLVSDAVCPRGCSQSEDVDCCLVVGKCWVAGMCSECQTEVVLKGDWNRNGKVDDPDLDVFLKVQGAVKGQGQNVKGYTYDSIFDFDDDGDVDAADYLAFDAAFGKIPS